MTDYVCMYDVFSGGNHKAERLCSVQNGQFLLETRRLKHCLHRQSSVSGGARSRLAVSSGGPSDSSGTGITHRQYVPVRESKILSRPRDDTYRRWGLEKQLFRTIIVRNRWRRLFSTVPTGRVARDKEYETGPNMVYSAEADRTVR